MNYKVLYRKYRPTNFDQLVGQDNIVKILKNSIIENKIAHAYIFTGPRGTGKTSTAKLFAKALNCPNAKDGIPCEECDNCVNFATSPDIIELDAASNNGVDYIREIKDGVLIAPTSSKYKIYIIDEVHMLTLAAWNAFLKTLEEPPQNVIFILATTEIQKVPITVLSRCQRFDFNRIDRELIQKHIKEICDKEDIRYKEDAVVEISYLSDGCMRDALSILDQLSKVSDEINMEVLKQNYGTVTNDDINKLYYDIIHNDLDELINDINNTKQSGVDIKIYISKIIENFIAKAVDMKKKNLSNNIFNHIKGIIKVLNDLLASISYSTNGYLMLQLDLLSFINSDDNKLSSREIEQVSSNKDIIPDNIYEDINASYYTICDEFINIRINNSFAGASKDLKTEFVKMWTEFAAKVKEENIKELFNITKDSTPVVVSATNAIISTKRESLKTLGNSRLDILENKFNQVYNKAYKFIYITDAEWSNIAKSFDKNKEYQLIDDSKFVNNSGSQGLAEDLFGNSVNVE
ncbi:MAG: DNA polymerase III subunit gamma/tau [Bacilli bacterium]|nr:DNA polymerase III subunit gamma/tau [Bacilli bacterium]